MNAFLLCLVFLIFLTFLSPVSAVGLGSDGVAAAFATAIAFPSTVFYRVYNPKNAAYFYNNISQKLDFTDWYNKHIQSLFTVDNNTVPDISTRPHKRTVTKVKLSVTCNVPASRQVNAGRTHYLIWAYMVILTMLFCGTCIVIYIQRQTIEELIKAHNELTFVVHNMPYSPFSISTNKHGELSNVPVQSVNSTDNTTFDDSGDSVAETSTVVSDGSSIKGKANRAYQKCRISIKKLMAAKL